MAGQDKLRELHLHRRDLLKGAAAAGGTLLLPHAAIAQQAPRRGGTLRMTVPYNPASVDPMTSRNVPDFNVFYAVYDALIDFDPVTVELRPGLAKAWRFADSKTLVLDLVEGVRFHDGAPFDAEAVKFNLERYKTDRRSNVRVDLASVAAIEVTGKSQVTLRLSQANVGLPAILTNRVGCMVSPKSVQEKGPNMDRVAVGTGPFKFVEWKDNASFKLVRNEDYWKPGLPYLDGIDIRIVNELNTAARTTIAGEADITLNMTSQQRAVAERSPNVVVEKSPTLIFIGALFNYARPPLDDVRVRQALNYAIDRPEYNRVIALGYSEPSSTILPKAHWACDPATADYYSHDLARAKKLLAEAGYPNGLDLEAWGWPDQASMQRQELFVSQLARAGVRMRVTPASPPQAIQGFFIEKKGAMIISPFGSYPDPSQLYEAIYGKTSLRNAGKIELPGFRELLDATMAAPDQESRKAAFAKLQRFTVEQALQLVQYIGAGVAIRSPKVQNFALGLLTTPKFTEVWFDA
jgi:peptide/nickel transport system substrate-binding protein/glutathione transport system substrate-binding protein